MNFWQKTKRFFSPAMEKPWLYIIMAWFASLLGTSTGYVQIYMIELFTDIFARSALDEFWPKVWLLLAFFTINIILLFIFRNFTWIYPQYNMEFDIHKKYFHKYFTGDNIMLEKIGTGRMIDIMINGASKWSVLVNECLNNILRWMFLLGLSGFLIAKVSGWYSAGIPLLFLVIFLNTMFFQNLALHWRKKRKEISVERSRMTTRMIMSKFEILQNHRMWEEVNNLWAITQKSIFFSKKSHTYSMGSWQLSRFIIGCFTWYICVGFFHQAQTYGVTAELMGEIGVVTGLMATFMSYYNLLIEWYTTLTKEFVHIDKLWDTFDHLKWIENYSSGKTFSFKKWNYEFKNIDFSYHKNTPVLDGLSFTIKWGARTALVGRSGSGKTTLMKLIAGYMQATNWKLEIDNQDIKSIRLDSYYPHIGYLTQDPSVFDGSIEENLLYGTRKNPSKKAIEKAIKLAECEFIYELEKWIKTEIGERWVRLSWGQKQRLAIAKIFLKDPEIILLDEPTAALDSYSEEKVAKAFEHLFEGRTVIVIAHRLQTVKSADDIIVLEKWKIVERGTHKQLLKLWGKYAGMVDLQSGRVREEDNEEKHEE